MEVIVHTSQYGPHQWPSVRSDQQTEMIVPLASFDADLGMKTEQEVRKQLCLDVPRSRVFVRGHRTLDPNFVYRTCKVPRLCTQAAMAPIAEWILYSGMLLVELPSKPPLCVFVGEHTVHVQKLIGCVDGSKRTTVPIELHIMADWHADLVLLRCRTLPTLIR